MNSFKTILGGGRRLNGFHKQSLPDKPLVTIITASFNSVKHLEQCIQSVVAQTYDNIEYLIVDGGSTDGSVDIIRKYESHIDYWISEPDEGIGDAWNKGLLLARGEIIGFLNTDDYYDSSSVSIAISGIDITRPMLTYGNTKFIDEFDFEVGRNSKIFRPNKICIGFGFMHTSCFASKKAYDAVGKFNPGIPIAVDTDWLVRAHKVGVEFKRLDNTINMRIGGISDRQKMQAFRQYMGILLKHGFPRSKVYAGFIEHWLKVTIRRILNIPSVQQVKTQLVFILLKYLNLSYSFIPLFVIKKFYLRIFGIKVGKKSYIHSPVRFFHFGRLELGNNTVVNSGCYLDNRRGIFIGKNVSIAHDVKIYTLGHEIDDPFFRLKGASVKIHDNVVIFANSLIMPGVEIGEGAVIYPGSVVVKHVKPYSVVGGNPAREVRQRANDVRYKLDYGYWFAN